MAGITKEGLVIKRLPEVIGSLREKATTIFQDLVQPGDVVDTSDSTTLGRIIGLVADELSDLWEASAGIYWAYDPNSATGVALDNLVMLAGITRRGEEPTEADIYVEGNPGTTISRNMQVRSSLTSNTYRVVADVPLSSDDCLGIGITITTPVTSGNYTIVYTPSHSATPFTITVPRNAGETQRAALENIAAEIANNHPLLSTYFRDEILFIHGAIEFQLFDFTVTTPVNVSKILQTAVVRGTTTGPVVEPANALNQIATPSLAWDNVWNPFAASTGSNRETDEELRIRFRNTKFQRGTNVIESLYTALYDLDGVQEVLIIDNDTDAEDDYGNPAHSFLVIVEGGLNSSVAQAIWRNRPVGIQSNGDVSVSIIDSYGFIRTVQFSRPTYVPIYMEIELEKGPAFPADGEEQIREKLVAHINNFGIDDDVIYTRLFTPINEVPYHQVNVLNVGTDPDDLINANVMIDYNQKAIISKENIVFI